ncbi:non-ribosomal peptide synthetase, partial [Hymenobacter rubripertinctus]
MEYLSESERAQQLEVFNATAAPYDQTQTLVSLFEAQVRERPDQVALLFAEERLSYGQLNARANALAHYLRTEYQVGPGVLVALRLARGPQLLVSLLGVLKAGGAYVPLDPDYPAQRLAYILADSQARLVLDEAALTVFDEQAGQYSEQNPVLVNHATDLAYVIYTSGSTGNPKGCMLQ